MIKTEHIWNNPKHFKLTLDREQFSPKHCWTSGRDMRWRCKGVLCAEAVWIQRQRIRCISVESHCYHIRDIDQHIVHDVFHMIDGSKKRIGLFAQVLYSGNHNLLRTVGFITMLCADTQLNKGLTIKKNHKALGGKQLAQGAWTVILWFIILKLVVSNCGSCWGEESTRQWLYHCWATMWDLGVPATWPPQNQEQIRHPKVARLSRLIFGTKSHMNVRGCSKWKNTQVALANWKNLVFPSRK